MRAQARMTNPRRIPEGLTQDEQRTLLAQPNPRYPTGLRNLCMMKLMLDAGLRAAELLNLTPHDIDWMSGKLTVRQGKGGKDRTLWINQQTLELLRRWRELRPSNTDLLFTTLFTDRTENKKSKRARRASKTKAQSTNDFSPQRIDDRYLRAMVKRYAQRAGITKDVHPHTLRHTFATDLYRQTKNIRLVQKALGHSDLSTTMIYTHVVDDELEDALKTFRNNQEG